ncbi:MaoC/PaaZ C-terminal domain-containing protein [Catenulispora rubra]|uniref:MaoC/PaaZ C-terminal domain-containing protein n=1 Tax=Catenulispora rubra TaxID=280293 RepID=UPI001892139A|nr:MaoC/PaaZ C-terminal domain-containing protein [Catenulispora rubra]
MSFNLEALGVWTEQKHFTVERERIAAYAAATNDPIAEHRAGDLAPPVFAVVPAFDSSAEAVLAVAPPELLMMLVHGEQDFFYHRPITPGMELLTRSAPLGVRQTSAGVVVAVKSETRTPDGDLVNEQWMSTFFRGAQDQQSAGEQAPPHALDDALRAEAPVGQAKQHVDEDQTVRYAEPSGDHNPIHLDPDFARAVGLPGIINHGLCTMAFASHAVSCIAQETCVAEADPRNLERLAVRFARPVLPGQDISTRVWAAAGSRAGSHGFAFETSSDADQVVIKDGLALFRRP